MITRPQYYTNHVDADVIEELKNIYYTANSYDTAVMKKTSADRDDVYDLLKTVECIDIDRIQVSLYYNHETPYLPHSDHRNGVNENFVIPLETVNEDRELDGIHPSLIIFDQWWPHESNTWVFNTNAVFEFNKELKGRPCDYDIIDKTDADIDDDLYNEYLNYFPKKYWRGLTGKPYLLQPGNVLMFDSRLIHATGAMKCKRKLGITIRYK